MPARRRRRARGRAAPASGHDHYHPWFSRLADHVRGRLLRLQRLRPLRPACRTDASTRSSSSPTTSTPSGGTSAWTSIDLDRPLLRRSSRPSSMRSREPGAVSSLVLSNAQVSAASWQRTTSTASTPSCCRLFPRGVGSRSAGCARGACSRSRPEYQELVTRVVPDLEWVDPWNHPPLGTREGGFEEAVYRSVVGPDPEWDGRRDAARLRAPVAAARASRGDARRSAAATTG